MIPANLFDRAARNLVVTGHPNHELAIFGFVQRMRPRLLFLTDGGGKERESESKEALASVGHADARFLGWPEERLYRALLERDTEPFREIVGQVRTEIEATRPQQVLCESIEYYNPLHDITLPIVLAASRGSERARVVEFPLIREVPGPCATYRVQRFPAGRGAEQLVLTRDEVAAKLRAAREIYRALRGQIGALLDSLPDSHGAVEFFAPAPGEISRPDERDVVRYEARGRLLKERGELRDVITHEGHFVPFLAALAG